MGRIERTLFDRTDRFEETFSQFLDSQTCEALHNTVLDLIRAAYTAGYRDGRDSLLSPDP